MKIKQRPISKFELKIIKASYRIRDMVPCDNDFKVYRVSSMIGAFMLAAQAANNPILSLIILWAWWPDRRRVPQPGFLTLIFARFIVVLVLVNFVAMLANPIYILSVLGFCNAGAWYYMACGPRLYRKNRKFAFRPVTG